MFRDDQNIVQASVRLIATIFRAVEGAVGFYISWQGMIKMSGTVRHSAHLNIAQVVIEPEQFQSKILVFQCPKADLIPAK